MKNFTYKLTATTFFSPVSITAENELDAIQELMDFYENGVLEIEDENFDLDKTAETQAYTPMVTPPPVIENGYVPLSSLSSSQDTYFGDDEEDDGDFDSDINYTPMSAIKRQFEEQTSDPLLILSSKLLEIIEQLGTKLEGMDQKIAQLEQGASQLPNGYRPLNNTRR